MGEWQIQKMISEIDKKSQSVDLNKKASEFVDKHMMNLYFHTLLSDRWCKRWLGLDQIQDISMHGRIERTKSDLEGALTATPEQTMASKWILVWFSDRHDKKWYTRKPWFETPPHFEKTFQEAVSTFTPKTILYNRLYEMMCTDLIQDLYSAEFPEYNFLMKKTSLYDDVMSWVDIIVSAKPKDHIDAPIQNIWIDLLSSNSQTSVSLKEGKNKQATCHEFNYNIHKNIRLQRIVCHVNPQISFMLLQKYLERWMTGKWRKRWELLQEYNQIRENHPEFHKWLDSRWKTTINDVLLDSQDLLKRA